MEFHQRVMNGYWTPRRNQRLREALDDAFDEASFDLLLQDYFGFQFGKLSPPGFNITFAYRIQEVINRAREEDWVLDLAAAARERRPKSKLVAAIAGELGLTISELPAAMEPGDPVRVDPPELVREGRGRRAPGTNAMPLTGQQIAKLAGIIDQQLMHPALDLIGTDLGVNLNNLLPGASVKAWAFKLIEMLNGRMPPEDGLLLDKLSRQPNSVLRAAAQELLRPTFLSPTGDAHDAIILGRTAFVARDALRKRLREFTNPSLYTTRVLVVRGEEPGGKSYSWEFLRHLAFASVGATARRLRLKNTNYTPRQFLEQAYLLLLLDTSTLPALADDPQLAKIDPLINAFKGVLESLQKRYWLVIDDLNEANVTPSIRETAYAIACAVEEIKPDDLWVALLGYNEPIIDPDLRHIALDNAEFPGAAFVARHLELIAKTTGQPMASARAREIADLLFTKYPKLTREAMSQLTVSVEEIGEKIRVGQQP